MRDTINAGVPGAYYSDLAQGQYRRGNYGAAALYGAESLVDAALGGAATRWGAASRAAETMSPAIARVLAAGAGGMAEAAARGAEAMAPAAEKGGNNVGYKVYNYLLNPDHSKGGPKANWFEQALGFTRENASDLAKQLVFDESQAVRKGLNEHGMLFNQTIYVTGANGRTIPITTGWIIGPDSVPRLTTAFPKR